MSEFLETCYAIREICKHTNDCRNCPLFSTHFCDHQPVSWTDKNLADIGLLIEDRIKKSPSFGQYLEQHGVISPNSDDRAIVQALYQTKVPPELRN